MACIIYFTKKHALEYYKVLDKKVLFEVWKILLYLYAKKEMQEAKNLQKKYEHYKIYLKKKKISSLWMESKKFFKSNHVAQQ